MSVVEDSMREIKGEEALKTPVKNPFCKHTMKEQLFVLSEQIVAILYCHVMSYLPECNDHVRMYRWGSQR